MPEFSKGSKISKDHYFANISCEKKNTKKISKAGLPQEIVSSFLHMQHPEESVNLGSPHHQVTYQCRQIILQAEKAVALQKVTYCHEVIYSKEKLKTHQQHTRVPNLKETTNRKT